jgi:short-subunit dehydrogenase
VVQAALPYLREQGAGHIIQMSSIGGLIAMPIGGGYLPSKWALEAMNESLAHEVAEAHGTLDQPIGDPRSKNFGT